MKAIRPAKILHQQFLMVLLWKTDGSSA